MSIGTDRFPASIQHSTIEMHVSPCDLFHRGEQKPEREDQIEPDAKPFLIVPMSSQSQSQSAKTAREQKGKSQHLDRMVFLKQPDGAFA
jgi:hypothetical protein